MEKNLIKDVYLITELYTWNKHGIVNQLDFNLKNRRQQKTPRSHRHSYDISIKKPNEEERDSFWINQRRSHREPRLGLELEFTLRLQCRYRCRWSHTLTILRLAEVMSLVQDPKASTLWSQNFKWHLIH